MKIEETRENWTVYKNCLYVSGRPCSLTSVGGRVRWHWKTLVSVYTIFRWHLLLQWRIELFYWLRSWQNWIRTVELSRSIYTTAGGVDVIMWWCDDVMIWCVVYLVKVGANHPERKRRGRWEERGGKKNKEGLVITTLGVYNKANSTSVFILKWLFLGLPITSIKFEIIWNIGNSIFHFHNDDAERWKRNTEQFLGFCNVWDVNPNCVVRHTILYCKKKIILECFISNRQ